MGGRGSGGPDDLGADPPLLPGEVRLRAGVGAVAVTARGALINLLALGGGIVLARLLLPRDFGVVAVGMTIVTLAYVLSDAGIGAAMIRSHTAPSRRDLEAILAFQLAGTILLGLLVAVVAMPFGKVGQVTAMMCLSLPLAAFRTPYSVLLERRLSFRPVAIVEVVEVAAYYAWAIPTVIAGWGVWGLATAVVVRAAVGSALMIAVAPAGILRPRFSWARTRPLLGFGLRVQGVGGLSVARDQALNLGTGALAGLSVLGLWTVARRLVQPGFVLFASLSRVSYPAMSRLVAAGEETRPIIERTARLAAAGSGLLIVPLVASSPALVPALMGSAWEEAAKILPFAGLGLMIAGPLSVAASGYLWAVGDAATPLRAAAADAVTWCAVSLPLVPLIGAPALGVGWLAAAVAQAAVFERALQLRTGGGVAAALAVPTATAALAAGVGWLASSSDAPDAVAAALGAGIGEALYLGGLLIVERELVIELMRTTATALRASLAHPSDAA